MTAVRSESLHWKPQPDTDSSNTSTRQQLTMTKKQAIDFVNQWYEAGRPIFTKKALQDLGEQLKSRRTMGDKVTVRGLTGAVFEGTVNLGHHFFSTTFANPVEREYIYLDLAIDYNHAGRLIADIMRYPDGIDIPISELIPLRLTHEVYPFGTKEEIWSSKHAGVTFEKERRAWETSEAHRTLEVLLSTTRADKINNIVGIACGSLSRLGRPNSAFQHALLLTAKDWLRKKRPGEKELSCYVQDPEYTLVDREVLNGVGIQVVDDPDGFLKVDDRSIVLSIAPNIPVKSIIVDIARPAMVIWLRFGQTKGTVIDPDSTPRITKMMEEYEDHRLDPKLVSDGKFRGAMVFIRKDVVTAMRSG
ncbi:hypothetical protein DTO013E5_2463 [Penicillium roqueforti]|uniref:uncharacterized protein n=1 Tax=Penicillium roqueforti TaxID=5082 RepID=UPI00190AE0E4|nr:uncharacterized protein LCP9604111_704 [Penicillium roqueforti]KAF9253178.1 hypothetical protein LCP9604111_704 [Penicillium roqueforti]KAI1838375.1 hypothetical protein CBS147337_100 [Penicillium roqueforti]KAI2680695.1 hypothetical protein CBS147355_3675 [Penicillium roqueforti]KAI2690915.1 hypothetical protein LCP963914a_1116 [Penicillium roqueforti]KAI2707129.1 hypothetical protein CBS147372_1040 [Penicillium roqueforti]